MQCFKGPHPPALHKFYCLVYLFQFFQYWSFISRGHGRGRSSRGRRCGGRDRGSTGMFQQYQGSNTNKFTHNGTTKQIPPSIDCVSHVSYGSRGTNTSSPSSRVLGSHPLTLICQICGSIGHQVLQFSNYFNHVFAANDIPKW